ncbi:uncharacterized protein LOC109541707 isoform X2 [Dendroctonus ponderosae]|nr:uncharacterized protein LOC109541707 isoform X2 [Dendroctonus ponderosae]
METQHIKYTECIFGKPNNYMWLCSKKPHMVYWMSTKDEIKIRNCLDRITQEQEIKVLKLVLTYLDSNPNASPSKVPEITLHYLNEVITCNIFRQAKEEAQAAQKPFSRMASFRESLRKLSGLRNKSANYEQQKRAVTFAEVPTIYRIPMQK